MSTATLVSKSSKVRPVKVALTHQHADGTIHALSGTDGQTVYVVRLGDTPSCTCPAGTNGRRCYHVATALAKYGAFYTAPWAVIVPATDQDPEPEPPTPAAPAVQCYTCGTAIALADATPHGCFVGHWNHADFEACRVARASVCRQYGIAA
jgi:SWIM zinc finger